MPGQFLNDVPHFRKLPEPALRRLAASFRARAVAAGETVYSIGDPVAELFVVEAGTIVLMRAGPDGQPVPDSRVVAGDIFGAVDLFDNDRRTETAQAAEASWLQQADREHLLSFLKEEPLAALNLRLAAARGHAQRTRAALAVAQRRAVRRRVNQEVRLTTEGAQPRQVTLVDISHLGICLKDAPPDWREDQTVQCDLAWREWRLEVPGRIVWRASSEVGIEFEGISPAQQGELQQAVGQMLEA